MSKKQLGAFYTTRAEEILKDHKHLVDGKDIVSTCAGDGDLLQWAIDHGAKSTIGYDINPSAKRCDILRDTILSPPEIPMDAIILENPPYLHKNKASDKRHFDLYGTTDLYKAWLLGITDTNAQEILAIIPSNFIVDQDANFRRRIFSEWSVESIVLFDERVFDDTDVRVCLVHLKRGETKELLGHKLVDTRIGKGFYKDLSKPRDYRVSRLLQGQEANSRLMLYATDTGTKGGEIRLSLETLPFHGKETDRNFATLTFNTTVSVVEQRELAREFNRRLREHRDTYDSLFLTNFRPGKDGVMRKRIAFSQAFRLIEVILTEQRRSK